MDVGCDVRQIVQHYVTVAEAPSAVFRRLYYIYVRMCT